MHSVSEDKPTVRVDATRSAGTLEPFWAGQIIHPTERLLTDEGREFLEMLTEAGATRQFVRIYNQPEEAIRVSDDGTISYNWNRFDAMADMVLATGSALKIVFFGMPYELARYPDSVKTRPNGAKVCISPPKDYALWQRMCSDFVAHVLSRYGLQEINRWTFRCWNEPDLKSFWHNADIHEYLKLYDYFAEGVKSVCPEVTIGGPALSGTKTYLNPENFTFFLDHITGGNNHATGGTGAPIDYLGVHTYGGSGGGPGPGQEYPNVAYLVEQQTRLAAMRDRYPQLKGVPIHVEEWGESSAGTNGVAEQPMSDIRNSEHSAAFLVSMVARHVEMKLTGEPGFASFTFCSSGYERPREHDFMGYRTFHTRNGFHKPLLNGYKLLNNVASELVETQLDRTCNRLHAFAARDDRRVTVVLCNYQPDRIDNDGSDCTAELTVALPWESDAKVVITHWRIDGKHSNAYAAYKGIGSPADPTPEQIQAVKARMDLEQIEPPRESTCAEAASLNVSLPCNGVSLIEFRRA